MCVGRSATSVLRIVGLSIRQGFHPSSLMAQRHAWCKQCVLCTSVHYKPWIPASIMVGKKVESDGCSTCITCSSSSGTITTEWKCTKVPWTLIGDKLVYFFDIQESLKVQQRKCILEKYNVAENYLQPPSKTGRNVRK
jgi:hypothetical protein